MANFTYIVISVVVLLSIAVTIFDKTYATDQIVTGRVNSIVPSSSKYKQGYTAYIEIENGPTITKSSGRLKVGSVISFRVYKSKLTGRVKYVRE